MVRVHAGLTVPGDCPIRRCPADDNEITFVFGEGVEGFELTVDRDVLSRFRDAAAEALAGA